MRILIIDDSEAVRRGVGGMLAAEESWEICGEASDSLEGLEKAQTLRPDVILLDMNMPGVSGLAAARLLRKEMPATRIVIMSQNDASIMHASAIQAGANACVDKASIGNSLVPTIRAVLAASATDAVNHSSAAAGASPAWRAAIQK
jgi:two-component system, NarL family, nitrate/nitrite response regulator NarL